VVPCAVEGPRICLKSQTRCLYYVPGPEKAAVGSFETVQRSGAACHCRRSTITGAAMKRRVTVSLFAVLGAAWMTSSAPAETHERAASPRRSPTELAAWVDALFARLWDKEGLEPAPVVDDATYLRRVYLDLMGRPSPEARRYRWFPQ
jgi:hypothetical protein